MVVLLFVCYLLGHFLLYAGIFRHQASAATEKGIFLYHLLPALAWVISLSFLAFLFESIGAAHVVLVAALHGIYSLTFLELWALADGGYSLAIMDCLEFRKELDEKAILAELMILGTAKKQNRVADLLKMGLVEAVEDRFQLTPAGRLVARAITAIVRITNASMTH